MTRLTEEYKTALWERYARGQSASAIARAVGRHPVTVAEFIRNAGGIRPRRVCRSQARLSLAEREEISRGLAYGLSLRVIAGRIGPAPSTVSREVERNGGRERYRALRADKAAQTRARRRQRWSRRTQPPPRKGPYQLFHLRLPPWPRKGEPPPPPRKVPTPRCECAA